MWRAARSIFKPSKYAYSVRYKSEISVPEWADVVIVGGGSAGCHTFYHLTKRGVKAVLLERAKLTAGTTWHTAGLIWRLRPNDIEIELLASSRETLMGLEAETGLDPGWIQNGGMFIAHSNTRMDEYKRLSSIGNVMGIENHILTPIEAKKIFPLLNETSFTGALYSPGDGAVDPTMLCGALCKASTMNGGKVIENCSVTDILTEDCSILGEKIVGVTTPYGIIKTNTIINATGVWGQKLVEKFGTKLPLVPMRHAYIITESIPGVRGLPNIRDHDYSIYFRIQGDSIQMGGYEHNPIILDSVPSNFHFSLYDLDWSVFDAHVQGSAEICPVFGKSGIKSNVCGPESFTPDHKPLMGPDPNLHGMFHHCGFNSAGMMFGGGCAEQTALWIINGRPERDMFQFDLRRFTPTQTKNLNWTKERSHEAYVRNYGIIFPRDQPLAGRNIIKDPLHEDMMRYDAIMDEKQGWERPAFFMSGKKAVVQPYDWYGAYGFKRNTELSYVNAVEGDLRYQFSEHHDLIGNEAKLCRTNAVVFNMCYFSKIYMDGPDAKAAADWLFTADTNREINKIVYTCMLNNRGGVEGDVTVSRITSGSGEPHDPKVNGIGYYIVSGGYSAYYSYNNMLSEIRAKGFKVNLKDVTSEMGVISIQGPKSREILQKIVDIELTDTILPYKSSNLSSVISKDRKSKYNVRILRASFVGELGYELHVPINNCSSVYNTLMDAGKYCGIVNAGYRALYSLSSEKGHHLWGIDLRSNDTPIEANLRFTCRKNGDYIGKEMVQRQLAEGASKKLVYFSLKDQIPIWGLEGVYRDGHPVGYLRRGDYAYTLGKSFGQAYIVRKDGIPIDSDFIKSGKYQIDIMGKLYDADCHLKSPFDSQGKRVLGIYQ